MNKRETRRPVLVIKEGTKVLYNVETMSRIISYQI